MKSVDNLLLGCGKPVYKRGKSGPVEASRFLLTGLHNPSAVIHILLIRFCLCWLGVAPVFHIFTAPSTTTGFIF